MNFDMNRYHPYVLGVFIITIVDAVLFMSAHTFAVLHRPTRLLYAAFMHCTTHKKPVTQTRSYLRSQTYVENSAATWRTQRSLSLRPTSYNPI